MATAQRAAYGAGSMTEKAPGVWRLRAMANGRQIERTFRGTEAAARKHLRSLADEAPLKATAAADARTFGDLLDAWMAHIEARGRAPKTLREYRRMIDNRIRPRLGATAAAAITGHDLDAGYSAWQADLADSSVHHHAAVISAAFAQGLKWGWIDTNPATRATPPANRSARTLVTPTVEQVAKLLRAAQDTDPIMAAAVALAFVTGARRGELCALKWSDVDLCAGVVRIERSLTEIDHAVTVKSTKTGRGRNIGLDALAVATLRRHAAWQADLSERAESPLVADPFVLSDNANGGRPILPSKITDRFTKLRARAGVRRVRFHDLRHASISEQLHAGVDPATVAARAGHASTKMTLDRYAHALPAGDVQAAAIMGGLLPRVTT